MQTPSENEFIGTIMVWIFGLIFLFFLQIVIIRWIFRINRIVELLEQIAHTHERDKVFNPPPPLEHHCAVCKKKYTINKLIKIDSGQLLCGDCHRLHKRFDNKKEGQAKNF
jgi:hypothetical protein